MSRTLKRVPLDFNWPRGKVWIGYWHPYDSMKCPACDGSGYNPATKKLKEDWYTHSRTDGKEGWEYSLTQDEVDRLVKGRRLRDLTRDDYYPTADEVNQWARTNFMGHDGINQMLCVEVRAKRLGVFGKCELCKGEGDLWFSDEIKKLSEEHESREPPEGEGYQLWETCSEGSPVSPVFKTLDELCEWCSDGATTFGSFKATKEKWREMLDDDYVYHKTGNVIFM